MTVMSKMVGARHEGFASQSQPSGARHHSLAAPVSAPRWKDEPMNLTDLEPRWYEGRSGDRQGITFQCPHCPGSGQRLAVAIHLDGTNFDPDPENPQQWAAGEHVWNLGPGGHWPR